MKLTVVTNFNSTIVYDKVADIKYVELSVTQKIIIFYSIDDEGLIKRDWQNLNDIRSIVLTLL